MEALIVRLLLLMVPVAAVLGLVVSAPANELQVITTPTYVVRLDAPGVVRFADGTLLAVPAGAEIDACGEPALRYSLPNRSLHITKPCTEIFSDGFEAQ